MPTSRAEVEKPKRSRRKKADVPAADVADIPAVPMLVADGDGAAPADDAAAGTEEQAGAEDENGEPRRGWWQRTFGT